MIAKTTFTLHIELPADIQVGDELDLTGRVTVHSLNATLIDTAGFNRYAWLLPGAIEAGVYANEIRATKPA